MLTAQYTGDRTITVAELAATPPARGEVEIRVAFTGLCGTDLHILHGNMDARVTTPLTFGHETRGTVPAVGEGVTGRPLGHDVTVLPPDWDGTCPACLAG